MFTWQQLSMATRILRARLAQTSRISIRVIEERDFERAPTVNDIEGQIYCFFTIGIKGMPVLLVFGREWEDEDISHIFAFYVSSRFKIIQPTERKKFISKLKPGHQLGLNVKAGIVNKPTTFEPSLHLSILVQMAEFLLDLDLMLDFSAVKQISDSPPCRQVPLTRLETPECSEQATSEMSRTIMQQASTLGIEIIDFPFEDPPLAVSNNVQVLKIRYLGHLFFGIIHGRFKLITVIISHPSMLPNENTWSNLVTKLKLSFSSSRLSYVRPTRFFMNPNDCCNSPSAFRAMMIAVSFPMVTIKECELDAIVPYRQPAQPSPQLLRVCASQENTPAGLLDESSHQNDPSPGTSHEPIYENVNSLVPQDVPGVHDERVVSIEVDDQVGEPISLDQSSQLSSQSTIIITQQEVADRVVRLDQPSFKTLGPKQEHPKRHALTPFDDPDNKILSSSPFLLDELDAIINMFELPMIRLPLTNRGYLTTRLNNVAASPRLALLPVVVNSTTTIILLTDRHAKRWGLINPDVDSQRDKSLFTRIQQRIAEGTNEHKHYEGHQINISCHFHEDYKYMHLLMSVFCFGQAFKIASELPKRLIYLEKRFRTYCFSVCLQLQLRNMDYNHKNGLVKENGYLKENAYRSSPSPVSFERATSSTNLCLFCEYRGVKLGSHMLMKHGGQARAKLEYRRQLENE